MSKKFPSVISKTKVNLEPLYFETSDGTHGINNNLVTFNNKSFVVDSGYSRDFIKGVKNNFNATSLPSSSNDNTEGYSVGSTWIYNNNIFKLTDDTMGLAIWKKVNKAQFGQKVWVSKWGNDDTGQIGYHNKPFLTIQGALDAVLNHPEYQNEKFLIHITPGDYLENIVIYEDCFLYFDLGANLEVNPSSGEYGMAHGEFSYLDTSNINSCGILGLGKILNNTQNATCWIEANDLFVEIDRFDLVSNKNSNYPLDGSLHQTKLQGNNNSSFINIIFIDLKYSNDEQSQLIAFNIKINEIRNIVGSDANNREHVLNISAPVSYKTGSLIEINFAQQRTTHAGLILVENFQHYIINAIESFNSADTGLSSHRLLKINADNTEYVFIYLGYISTESKEIALEVINAGSDNTYYFDQNYENVLINIDYIKSVSGNIRIATNNNEHLKIKANTLISQDYNFNYSTIFTNQYSNRYFVDIDVDKCISSGKYNINLSPRFHVLKIQGIFINTNSSESFNFNLKSDVDIWQKNGGSGLNGDYNVGTFVTYGQFYDFKKISAGFNWALALNENNKISAWGEDIDNQVTDAPTGRNDIINISTGNDWGMVLKSDNSIIAWGKDSDNQVTDAPTNRNDIINISAGFYWGLALKNDNSIIAWGRDIDNQVTDAPTGRNDIINISAGSRWGLALKDDNSIITWGYDGDNQVTDAPTGRNDITKISASRNGLVLKDDNSIIAWGKDDDNQVTDAPTGRTDITNISAGDDFGLAITSSGTIIGWGQDSDNQVSDIPDKSDNDIIFHEYYICTQETGSGTNAPTGLESDNTWWEWQPSSLYEINFMNNTMLITNKDASTKGWCEIDSPVNYRAINKVISKNSLYDKSGTGKGKVQNLLSNDKIIYIEPNLMI